MSAATGPFTVACLLLALGGAHKAASPDDTANALRGVGLPAGPWTVRVGGGIEVAIGLLAVAAGGPLAASLVAASYLMFAAFVTTALARGVPLATCGCFGKADTPPSLVHLGYDLAAAIAALVLVVDPMPAIDRVVAAQPLAGVPYLLLVATGVFVSFLALTLLPRTLALAREARTP